METAEGTQNDERQREFVGRDKLITELWTALDADSIVMIDAARRLGKTTLMQRMAAEPPKEVAAYWLDLEDLDAPEEFFHRVFQRCKGDLPQTARLTLTGKSFVDFVSGLKLGPVQLPNIETVSWKSLLRETVTALLQVGRKRVVLFLDEIPLMLHKVLKSHGAVTAGAILDLLRSLAVTHSPSLTIVYAGSLGLHHVRKMIKRETGVNSPDVNIGRYFTVPPLDESDAINLADMLLKHRGLRYSRSVSSQIAAHADCIPFYIRRIVLDMRDDMQEWSEKAVYELVERQLANPIDVWHIHNDHFARLDNADYYEPAFRDVAYCILDAIARSSRGVNDMELLKTAKETGGIDGGGEAALQTLLSDLCADHVLERNGHVYGFKYSIIRRHWQLQRPSLGEQDES